MVFQDTLVLVKKEVERELAVFLARKQQEAKHISPHCVALVDQVRGFTMRGGKRTRAFLCWLGYETTVEGKRQTEKGKTENTLLYAMMGLELFQSFALIHDDIMDEDTTRRGGPSVHEVFRINALTHQRVTLQNAEHFGKSMAILAGDLALVWADELMKKGKRQTENGKREDIYQKMKEEVIYGQSLDVLASVGLPSADRATMNRYKTAWYSVIRPLQIGASLAGADEKTLESFVPYGLAVGEAYQLRDDILDGAIRENVFQSNASKLQKRMAQAVKKLNVSQSSVTLFGDFSRFALSRPA